MPLLIKILLFILIFLALSGCSNLFMRSNPTAVENLEPQQSVLSEATSTPTQLPVSTEVSVVSPEYPWWNNTVFYEIFVRSFYDSNSDGIGDFQGLIQKLDYLNDGDPSTDSDLGITGIWLMPIFDSTSYHGYDVIDYYSINPDYGTMDDFKEFLAEAHSRNIRVIIDFVVNHTSVEHPWFKESRSDENSIYRDWYIWSESDPGYLGPWGEDVWHFNFDNQYYYGVFWSGMPDLNFKNPAVTKEINKISAYWLSEIGVDGFRVDGARHLIEEGKVQANTDATIEWFQSFNELNKKTNPQIMTVGEVWDSNFSAVRYIKEGAFDLVFDFELSVSLIEGINGNDGKQITNALDFNTNLFPYLQKANFLTNHDMNRVMDVFQDDIAKAKIGALLLLTAPGVPFIYYGEEIGMKGSKPDEDIRKPMQWDSTEYAGFSSFLPWRPLNSNFDLINVGNQENDPDSLLNLYKELIHIRNSTNALSIGDFQILKTNQQNVVVFVRKSVNQTIIIISNVGQSIDNLLITIPKNLLTIGDYEIRSLLDSNQFNGFKIETSDNDFDYLYESQIPSGKYFLIELTKR